MKQSLEKAIGSSHKGYIDGYNEIDRIFTKLLEMPMEQFGGIPQDSLVKRINALLDWWDITPTEKTRSALTVGEFFGLVKELEDDPSEDTELDRRFCYLFILCLEEQLQKSENDTARLFRYFSINDFLRYAAKKAGRSKSGITNFYRIFKRDVKKTMGFTINEGTTIREYMKKLWEIQAQRWCPNKPISEFEEQIRDSYDEFAYLILESSKLAFPSLFDHKAIKLKYDGISCEKDDDKERNDEQWQIS